MNVDEFLQSSHLPRRTEISVFDAEVRQLRAKGVSYEGIAIFLRLHNVEVSGRAVNAYFKRHPTRYGASKTSTARKGRSAESNTHNARRPPQRKKPQSDHADLQSRSDTVDVQQGHHGAAAGGGTIYDADPVTPRGETDAEPLATAHPNSDANVTVREASNVPRSDLTATDNAHKSEVSARPNDFAKSPDAKGEVEPRTFRSEPVTDTPYDSIDVRRAPPATATTPEQSDAGTDPLADLFKPIDFNSPDFLAARKNVRSGQ